MPRFPSVADSLTDITGSVYTALAQKLASYQGELYPFHVGDTWMEPAVGARMQDLTVEEYPGMHRYAPPQGLPQLLAAIARQVESRTGLPTTPQQVLVATGATGALGAVAGALLDPGDEVLIAAPYWPLIAGIVRSFHGRPIAVPIVEEGVGPDEIVARLDRERTARTVALYLNTPNNPTGRLLDREQLETMADWASQHGLWIWADEVYEEYAYGGEHVYTRPLAPERTFAVYSFSKAYGMAGNRCGYVVGPEDKVEELRKVSTHTFYSTPTASQLAAVRALDGRGDRWVAEASAQYREAGRHAAERLGLEAPQGSTFLFFDAREHLAGGSLAHWLEALADRGIFLAPGASFGPYPTWVRLCFTAAPPDVTRRGVDLLAEALGRPSG